MRNVTLKNTNTENKYGHEITNVSHFKSNGKYEANNIYIDNICGNEFEDQMNLKQECEISG